MEHNDNMVYYPTAIARCAHCNQGLLEIVKDKTGSYDKLYVECSEQFTSWKTPEDVFNNDPIIDGADSDITWNDDIRSILPTLQEIKDYGWDKYLMLDTEELAIAEREGRWRRYPKPD